MERRVWKFPQYVSAMSDALRLRSALLPYTYSSAADAALVSSVATMHPLYIDFPGTPEAYTAGDVYAEYLFGPSLLASPIWETNASTIEGGVEGGWKSTWLPSLEAENQLWCTWNGTECLSGDTNGIVERFYPNFDTPIFVRSGSIIPMQTLESVGLPAPDPLVVTIFPFSPTQNPVSTFSLYEDAGQGGGYKQGEFWRVPLTAGASSFTMGAATSSDWIGAPEERGLEVRWRGLGRGGANKTVRSAKVNGGMPLSEGGPGCPSGCFYFVSALQHSLLAPEGTLVVIVPGKLKTSVNNSVEVILN